MEINTINAYRYLLVLLLIVSFVSPTLSLGVLDSISVSYWKSWHTPKNSLCVDKAGYVSLTTLQTPSILNNRIPFQWLNLAAGSERSGPILFGWLKVLRVNARLCALFSEFDDSSSRKPKSTRVLVEHLTTSRLTILYTFLLHSRSCHRTQLSPRPLKSP